MILIDTLMPSDAFLEYSNLHQGSLVSYGNGDQWGLCGLSCHVLRGTRRSPKDQIASSVRARMVAGTFAEGGLSVATSPNFKEG